MNCTHCGGALPQGARFCGNCGTASKPALTHQPNPLQKMSGCGFALLLVGALVVAAEIFGTGDAPSPPAAKAAPFDPKVAAAKAKICDNALAELGRAGVMKDRPSADTIIVEEDLWAQLPASQKRLFAAAVRCSLLGGTDSDDPFKSGFVEGYRSGKELAIAGSSGVTLD